MDNDKSAIQVIAGAARCPEYSPSMVKALMKKLETNEKAFALLMNVTPSTVRLWTTGAARGGRQTSEAKEQTASCGK